MSEAVQRAISLVRRLDQMVAADAPKPDQPEQLKKRYSPVVDELFQIIQRDESFNVNAMREHFVGIMRIVYAMRSDIQSSDGQHSRDRLPFSEPGQLPWLKIATARFLSEVVPVSSQPEMPPWWNVLERKYNPGYTPMQLNEAGELQAAWTPLEWPPEGVHDITGLCEYLELHLRHLEENGQAARWVKLRAIDGAIIAASNGLKWLLRNGKRYSSEHLGRAWLGGCESLEDGFNLVAELDAFRISHRDAVRILEDVLHAGVQSTGQAATHPAAESNTTPIAQLNNSQPRKQRGRRSKAGERRGLLEMYERGLEEGSWKNQAEFARHQKESPGTIRSRLQKARDERTKNIN